MSDTTLRELERRWRATDQWSDWVIWARESARLGDPLPMRLLRSAERTVRLNEHARDSATFAPDSRRMDLFDKIRCRTEAERLRAIRTFSFLFSAGQNPPLAGAPWALGEFIRGYGVSLQIKQRAARARHTLRERHRGFQVPAVVGPTTLASHRTLKVNCSLCHVLFDRQSLARHYQRTHGTRRCSEHRCTQAVDRSMHSYLALCPEHHPKE